MNAMDVVQPFFEAWNAHSAGGMADLVADDFELFYFTEKGVAELQLTGPEALRAAMTDFFKQQPEAHSTIIGRVDGQRFIAFREQVNGGDSAIAVYEVEGDRLQRAWYYPAEPPAT